MKEYLGGLSKIIMKIFISQIDPPPINKNYNYFSLNCDENLSNEYKVIHPPPHVYSYYAKELTKFMEEEGIINE